MARVEASAFYWSLFSRFSSWVGYEAQANRHENSPPTPRRDPIRKDASLEPYGGQIALFASQPLNDDAHISLH